MVSLGDKICHERKNKGLSQEGLAQVSGISLRTIQRVEGGKVDPQPHTLKKLTDVLNLDLASLNDRTGVGDELLSLRMMLFSCLLFFLPIVSNIVVPVIIWSKHKHVATLNDLGSRVISFQVLWTMVTLLLIFLTPIASHLLTGASSYGQFPAHLAVSVFMLLVNFVVTIIFIFQTRKNNNLLAKVPKML